MSENQPKPKGRPSSYTQEISDKFCDLIAQGLSLRSACKSEDMPSPATVFKWMREHPDFLKQYARACDERTEAMSEDILDIADDGENDYMTIKRGDQEYEVVNREAIQRSQLRVETRKWLMAKMKPKKYGDKLEVDNTGEITHKYEDMTDEQLEQAIKARQDRIIGTGS